MESQKGWRMEKMMKGINTYSGVLTFVTFIAAVLFYVFGFQTQLDGLSKDHVTERTSQKEYQEQTIAVLTEIRDSLKEKGHDHKIFYDQVKENIVAVNEVSKAMIRISISLENIDKKLERMR